MHLVPTEQVRELRAATDVTRQQQGAINPEAYRTSLESARRLQMPDLRYLFSIPLGWDVLEVVEEYTHANAPVLSAAKDQLKIGEVGPEEKKVVLRTLILTPASAEAETRALLGLPRWDRFVRITAVLADKDQYWPLEVMYRGTYDTPISMDELTTQVLQVLSSPEFFRSPEVPAPTFSETITEWRNALKTETLMGHRKQELINELASLDEDQFIEALYHLVPVTEHANSWLLTEPKLAERAWLWAQEHPEYEAQMMHGPWKTGRPLPRNYDPRVDFQTPQPVPTQRLSF